VRILLFVNKHDGLKVYINDIPLKLYINASIKSTLFQIMIKLKGDAIYINS